MWLSNAPTGLKGGCMRHWTTLIGTVGLGFLSSSEASFSQISGSDRTSGHGTTHVANCSPDITSADEDLTLPDPIIWCGGAPDRALTPWYGASYPAGDGHPEAYREWCRGITHESGYVYWCTIDPPPANTKPTPPHEPTAGPEKVDWQRTLPSAVPPVVAPPVKSTQPHSK